MKNKEQLTEKDIRRNVVLGIFQWFGYLILIFILICILLAPFFLSYQAGKIEGNREGVEETVTFIINITQKEGDVHLYSNTLNTRMTLEQKHYCNNMFTSNADLNNWKMEIIK